MIFWGSISGSAASSGAAVIGSATANGGGSGAGGGVGGTTAAGGSGVCNREIGGRKVRLVLTSPSARFGFGLTSSINDNDSARFGFSGAGALAAEVSAALAAALVAVKLLAALGVRSTGFAGFVLVAAVLWGTALFRAGAAVLRAAGFVLAFVGIVFLKKCLHGSIHEPDYFAGSAA